MRKPLPPEENTIDLSPGSYQEPEMAGERPEAGNAGGTQALLAAVTRINDLFLSSRMSPGLFSEVAAVVAAYFEYPFCSVVLFDEGARNMWMAGINDPHPFYVDGDQAAGRSPGRLFAVAELTRTPWYGDLLSGKAHAGTDVYAMASPFLIKGRTKSAIKALHLQMIAVVPLVARRRLLGALVIGSRKSDFAHYERTDIDFISQHTAIALEMSLMRDQAVGRTALLSKLHSLSRSITSTLDLDQLYLEVVAVAGELVNIDFCTINTVTADGQGYENRATWNRGGDPLVVTGTRPLSIFPRDMVARGLAGEILLIEELKRYPTAYQHFRHRHAEAMGVFPFQSQGKVVGFITVGRRTPGKWRQTDVEIVKQLSEYVSVAFTNGQLYMQATRRAKRMAMLHSTVEQLAHTHEAQDLYSSFCQAVSLTVDAPVFRLSICDEAGTPVAVRDLAGFPGVVNSSPTSVPPDALGQESIQKRETIYVSDLAAADAEAGSTMPKWTGAGEPRSALSVPLLSAGQVFGAITVKSYKPYAYDPDDIQVVQILASQAAIALERRRLFEEAQKRAAEQEALAQSANAIARLDLHAVLQTIVERASELVHSSRCSVMLYDEETDELCWAAGHNNTEALKAARFPASKGVVGTIFATGQPLVVDDIKHDPRSIRRDVDAAEQTRAFMGVPLRGPTGTMGVLVTSSQVPGAFSERDLNLLTTFADHATIALANADLYNSLQQRESERAMLLHQVLTSQEAERRRMAVDIHDGPLQSIGVNLLAADRARKHLSQGNTELALAELSALREGMASVSRELREVISDLRPTLLDLQGFAVAAHAYLRAFSAHHGISATLEDELGGERLPGQLEITFYRLMQEALTNVRKHANATSVRVRINVEHGHAILCIVDNGRGFRPEMGSREALVGGHIGLHSMSERIEIAGGKMQVRSGPGEGTRITFAVPINRL